MFLKLVLERNKIRSIETAGTMVKKWYSFFLNVLFVPWLLHGEIFLNINFAYVLILLIISPKLRPYHLGCRKRKSIHYIPSIHVYMYIPRRSFREWFEITCFSKNSYCLWYNLCWFVKWHFLFRKLNFVRYIKYVCVMSFEVFVVTPC